jgi:hypothetical protein
MPLTKYRTPFTKRIILGDASQTGNLTIPINNYDPIIFGNIASNTSSVFTTDFSNIGNALDSNSAYAIELSNGRFFFLDTSTTKTSANSTATILTVLGFPLVLSGESFANLTFRIRRVISFYDLIFGGLVISGTLKSGASGTGDQATVYTETGSAFSSLFRTSTTWRNSSNVTINNYPVNAFTIFQRTALATGGTAIIEVPISKIV